MTAGLIAQWSPDPLVVAYLPHLVVMALVLPGMWHAPETVIGVDGPSPSLLSRLRVPTAFHPRFVTVVVPLAPWVFGAAAVSFAVLPSVVGDRTKGYGFAFAGVVAGLTLGVGVVVQPMARRIDRDGRSHGASVGLGAVVLGMLLGALAVHLENPLLVLLASAVLGAGYGFCLVAGLLEVQHLAGIDDLAGLNAVFYAMTYVGFAVPIALAELSRFLDYPELLLGLAALATLSFIMVVTRSNRTFVRPLESQAVSGHPVVEEEQRLERQGGGDR
jgi:hypothetical protein